MQIKSEADILDQGFRKKVIDEINAPFNLTRKAEAYKRYECFKDKTYKYVMELLLRQFDSSTVYEMQYALTNISLVRKVVDKLARVYANGAVRTAEEEQYDKVVEDLATHLKMNQRMKKANRTFKLQKNLALYVRPVKCDERIDLDISPLSPFLYDVIPDPGNEHKAMVCILSDYVPDRGVLYAIDPATANRTSFPNVRQLVPSDSAPDSIIAEPGSKEAEEKDRRYVWWSKNYHFTTNSKGEIVASSYDAQSGAPIIENPVKKLPFVTLSEDQDDSFWSEGGDDLADSGIKINTMLTNINHIAITQGYGQPIMSGKNPPKTIKLGPNHCITMEQNEGEPNPVFDFVSANPPIADLVRTMEMYIALLLSTNNLSTSSVASNLSGGKDFASGIALMLDKAESMEDVQDQQQVFYDAEKESWALVEAWLEYLQRTEKGSLVDVLQTAKLPVGIDVAVSFPQVQLLLSEKEKLEIIEKRKDLGINTMVELLMKDDPTLTMEAAEEKLKKIIEEKINRMIDAMSTAEENKVEATEETPTEEVELDGGEDEGSSG